MSLRTEITTALNRASAENDSNTPDHVLAEYLMRCLDAFNIATNQRDYWYGIAPEPGNAFRRQEEEQDG